MKGRILFLVVLLPLIRLPMAGRQFVIAQHHGGGNHCLGRVWIANGHFFCKDFRSKEVSKNSLDGTRLFDRLEAPPVTGHAFHVTALSEDESGSIFVSDGGNVHLYSPDGKYKKTITPGIQMALGMVALDSNRVLVAGHAPWNRSDSSNSLFVIGPAGIEHAFSSPFFPNATGTEGLTLNTPSWVALDKSRGRIYQLSQYLYEIRVFDLNGKLLRTIVPPSGYGTKLPNLIHVGQGVGVGPSDTLNDLAVLPNGGLVVLGAQLIGTSTQEGSTSENTVAFTDVYDAEGNFLRRINEPEMRLEGLPFRGIDHVTGRLYFGSGAVSDEAELR